MDKEEKKTESKSKGSATIAEIIKKKNSITFFCGKKAKENKNKKKD